MKAVYREGGEAEQAMSLERVSGVEPSSVRGTQYIGKPLLRPEDRKLLSGRAQYVDDVQLRDMAFCCFLRSPHAHARIVSIDTDAAEALPGVLKVITAKDWTESGLGELTVVHPMPFSDGRPMNTATRPAFAKDKVRHVGDIVAAVIAESRDIALQGVESIIVEFEALPAVSDVSRALDPDAPLVHEQFGTNAVFEVRKGDEAETLAALAAAHHVTELVLPSNRLAPSPIEPRSYVCSYDAADDRYTLWAPTQQPHYLRRWLAVYALFIPEHKLQVISPAVGGSFGIKGNFPVEVSTVVWASRLIGRPVKWTATRSEALMSDTQARDHYTTARMGFSADGQIVALYVDTVAALGGYLSNFAPSIPGNSYPQTITGLYRTPKLFLRVRGAYTNTVPVDAYRGSGRPEACWVNERLLENGARELGIDVVEIRKRNMINAEDFPYRTLAGRTYDSGNPTQLFRKLLDIADYDGLRRRQAELRRQGQLMGIGLACFLDKAGTGPSANLASRGGLHGGYESAVVRVHSDGRATVMAGTHCHGQGHRITYAAIAAQQLGIPVEHVDVLEGDTDKVPFGNGTWGGRSTSVAGSAILKAATEVIHKATRLAAHLLGCAVDELVYEASVFRVPGTDKSITFARVADVIYHAANLPQDGSITPGLEATAFYDPPDSNDPQAMHLAVVMVDPETGVVRCTDYFTADDCGTIINPMIVEGQVHGGLAQGLGQALLEQVVYDHDTGQLISGSFTDYAMPRADNMPRLTTTFLETPAPSNPLGVKGGSESGAIGPPAAIGNAVVDALWDHGVKHIPTPLTSEKVWQAIRQARMEK
ncbi:MAG: xanthine dehydrogenase family protein molybdopterin-binding subunit [Pigmentiphaga sp.]|uniref:xanthine dehydrogenase family protein molybdopterin-binding subunit n=1 Tax=Pigmentiphaga sp. TaxID=1977564 RepID=UPI0029BE9058|nr:xanthine dehydrogenase family protein molybdopterin-binding subunit [Pigmentiphaga sp.]MDX3905966.1 xanthine dehydrogenase family protein molybdopterin-binding subunit [Pigmentiphaga sp.]